MCGIAGIVRLDGSIGVDETRLKRMRDVLRHRGPDGEGLWIDGAVGLAHRRLSIVDVAAGQQPMSNEDDTAWIVYNGEIYNHAGLRPGLEARGHCYRTRSDTETILHLWEDLGERCVERLQGMFAFAIWDRGREELCLARDRLGIKPLYYMIDGEELLFASEIKAILAVSAQLPAFNDRVLPEYLATGFTAGEETFYRGVRKLRPGHTLTWSRRHGVRQRRYWALPEMGTATGLTFRQAAEEVRERLRAAVASHLMSDVPLGLFLSGGIDSSILAALMAPMVTEPIRTFSVAFDEPGANELPYARMAASAVGAEHREVIVSPREFFEALPRLIWHEDEPIAFTSSVPLYFVSRLARDHVKVVLTGEGADELFLGYNRYRVTAWNHRFGRAWQHVPGPLRAGARRLAEGLPGRAGRYAARSFLARGANPRDLFYENFSVFGEGLQRRLLADPARLTHDPYEEGLGHYHGAAGGPLDRMSAADLQTYLVELLMKQDQMSMAASIESRVPFLDTAFAEYAVGLPARFKLRGWRTKAVLREAVKTLVPPAILTRKKMGFPVPVGRWLQGEFWPLVEEFVLGPRTLARGFFNADVLRGLAHEHRAGAASHAQQLWALINLEMWHRSCIEGDDVTSLRARA
ncbi:MAG TPA: asparagine synthase (glutamine-hydrolyzing) [Candidatus Limnocylindria bacterium]|nr:asparagine synthase (glutamine-hydrolyzing) [Candidatus Limnocylindria bacterium]